jgi:conjugal transfer pilin signal peptidase TrbI
MSTLTNNHRTPETPFGWLLNALLVGLMVYGLMAHLKDRYLIGHDGQLEPCLLGQPRWFLIDTQAVAGHAGDLIAFRSDDRMAPEIPQGTLVIKRIEGVEGQRIRIEALGLGLDQQRLSLPYPHRDRLKDRALPPGKTLELKSGEYFVLGDHPRSFDSRYFGAIAASQWVGVAHALF